MFLLLLQMGGYQASMPASDQLFAERKLRYPVNPGLRSWVAGIGWAFAV